jgi:hypothetical protein
MAKPGWLLLLYGLPTRHSAQRVCLWRRLKKFGALQLKTSAYVLPDEPAHFERFQWLAKQVRDGGGEATLIRVCEIEGLAGEAIQRMFNDARADDYRGLMKSLARLVEGNRRRRQESFRADLDRLARRFNEIRAIDYFDSPAAHDAEMLLRRAEGLGGPRRAAPPSLDPKRFVGRAWITRPRPEIDRVGSAWLIRKFIDPKARFLFGVKPSARSEAIPYDLSDVEFSHQGEDCTYETMLKRFDIRDPAARQIGEMIHDADLEDGRFRRYECLGLDRLFKGWARLGLSDGQILAKGFECFDALYASLQSR